LIDCMNNTGYSLAILGNTDISFPSETLDKNLTKSSFSILASNVYLKKTGAQPPYAKVRHILNIKNNSIGFFSINTFDEKKFNSAKTLPFYRLEKENYEIARNVNNLKKSGAKIIIMLLNITPLKKDFRVKEFYKLIAKGNYSPDIVIVNGLTSEKQVKINHTYFINQVKNSSIALKTDISINSKTGKLSGVSSKNIILNKKDLGENTEILKIETTHKKNIARIFDKKIGSSNVDLKRSPQGLSSLANWIALCMKNWSRAQGALITADKLTGNISKGIITKRDIYELMDYNTHIVYLKLRGDSLRAIINANLDKGLGLAGITLSIKNNTADEIKIRNRRLIPSKIYQIAVPDYMLNEEKYQILPHAVEFVNKPQSILEILKWQLRRTRKPVEISKVTLQNDSVKEKKDSPGNIKI
ncbi:MAG: 5'-nucleotidase C-terminal domain-containing protein, partial [Elusimicrobia bacterium]|nr:5'-nucleotidase C-terminal domain-containing protein [Elusimicrobiota bacterium]